MMHRGVVTALEQEEAIAVATPDPVVPDVVIEDTANSVETDIIEANDVAADIEAATTDTEESLEIAEALESIAEDLKVSMANGGLDRYAASAIDRSVKYMYGRLGINKQAMPSMESFGGVSNRIESTRLAMENIKEGLKKAWEAVVAAFEKIMQWAKDFYTKVFQSFDKLQARAEEFAKKAGELKGDAKEKEIENDRIAKALSLGGKFDVNALVENTGILTQANIISNKNANINSAKAWISDIQSSIDDAEFTSKLKAEPINEALPGFNKISNPETEGFSKPKEGLFLYRSEELPGNKAILYRWVDSTKSGEEAAKLFGGKDGIGSNLGDFNPKQAELKDTKLPVLTSEQVGKLTAKVIEICKAASNYKKNLPEVEAEKKKMIAAAKRLSTGDTDTKIARGIASAIASNIDQPAAAINIYLLNTCKVMLDYVSLSMKQYGAKAEAKPEEKKPEDKPEEKPAEPAAEPKAE